MDEPSDFPIVQAVGSVRQALSEQSGDLTSKLGAVADALTFTTQGANALNLSGTYAQSVAAWSIYRSPEGHTIIASSAEAAKRCTAPTHKTPGWEGHGAQPKDDPESNHFDTAMKRLEQAVERMHREMAGAQVANAITAIHNQQPRDGRPSRFIQEVE